jgi:hypothetical protein
MAARADPLVSCNSFDGCARCPMCRECDNLLGLLRSISPEHAGGIPLDGRPSLELAGCWTPASLEPLRDELVRRGLMVPDRDHLHRAQSGGAIDEPPSGRQRYEDVVGELILLDHVRRVNRRFLSASPGEDLVQSTELAGPCKERVTLRVRKAGVISERDLCHLPTLRQADRTRPAPAPA